MNRYICIHGHFYQPPRENPWLDAISYQESAYPFHDWNERINAECYAPNTHARILDEKGVVSEWVNNYSKISFDFGPTLLSWMESKVPDTYQAVIEADRMSREKFSGHGSAMAQCFSHMIMPLANSRDKYTQVYWGIRDFEFRFKRFPEGMWLPETAVDLETLQIMADLGVGFTVLDPRQAGRIFSLDGVDELDIYRPYRINLKAGSSINVFFYNGALSQSLAFENLLQDGKCFAEKLINIDKNDGPQLISVATDGETYGHHHKFGDMALAFALQYIDSHIGVHLTNYAEYLEKFPPQQEIEIIENTSWSCAHGVSRWKSHCGCETGGHPDWNQNWRAPLRDALDWLQAELDSIFIEFGKDLLKDPWEARNRYIDICINHCDRDTFFTEQSLRRLERSEETVALKLLELQRNSMLMYTSCGWFFNDISGIETEQILLYAGKAIQLAEEVAEKILEPEFLKLLELAESNVPEKGNGALIYTNITKEATEDIQI
jgi:alpha-amylase/alpha-mannosidase (GH57 family)